MRVQPVNYASGMGSLTQKPRCGSAGAGGRQVVQTGLPRLYRSAGGVQEGQGKGRAHTAPAWRQGAYICIVQGLCSNSILVRIRV